jgi:preprotein translocase subunit YajC
MSVRKLFAASAFSVALLFTAAASAQAPAVGAAVTDPQGGAVGTITAADAEYVTLRTNRHEVRLPVASFTVSENAVLIALTQDQLNTQMDEALARAQQAFAVGATVYDRAGATVGQVTALDEQTLTVQLGAQAVRLPRSAVAAGQNGLMIGATVAELQAQLGGGAAAGGTN